MHLFLRRSCPRRVLALRALDYAPENGIDGVGVFLVALIAEVLEIFDVLFCKVDAVHLARLGVKFS